MKRNNELETMHSNDANTVKAKKPSKLIAFLKSRNAKRGSIAIALTVIFIAVIVGLNIVAKLLTERFPILSTDLTSSNVYELTDTSLEYLDELDKDVTIYALMDEKTLEAQGEYYVQANKLLHEFENHSKHIKLKYIDLASNPSFATSYPDINWTSTSYLLLIEYGDEYLAVANEDVFTYDQEYLSYYGEYVINGQKIEQAVLTATLNITTDEKIAVTILSGHGELENPAIASVLSNNAYSVETVSLLNGEISKDSQFVIIYAPKNDIDKDTYDTLVDWLYNDGNYGHTLLYVPNDMVSVETPYIDTLLEEWNMSVSKNWVFETDVKYMTNSAYPNLMSIYNYEDTEFSSGIKDKSIPVVMMYCMPIDLLDTNVTSLLSTSDNAVKMPLDADESWDYNDEEPQKLCGAAISTQGNEEETKSSNVIVFGSYSALSESAFSVSSFNNSAYFVNLFNTIAQRDSINITIEGKSLENTELGITSLSTATLIGLLFFLVVPLAVIVVGIVVWLRRRHK